MERTMNKASESNKEYNYGRMIIPEDVRKEICRLYLEGYKTLDIHSTLQISYRAIGKVIKEEDLCVHNPLGHKYPKRTQLQIVGLYLAGRSLDAIKADFGCSREIISYYAKKYGKNERRIKRTNSSAIKLQDIALHEPYGHVLWNNLDLNPEDKKRYLEIREHRKHLSGM